MSVGVPKRCLRRGRRVAAGLLGALAPLAVVAPAAAHPGHGAADGSHLHPEIAIALALIGGLLATAWSRRRARNPRRGG